MLKLKRIPFICGFFLGILLYVIYKSHPYDVEDIKQYYLKFNFIEPSNNSYLKWFQSQNATRQFLSSEDVVHNQSSFFLESEFLYNSVTLYCIVLVRNENYIETVKATWLNGCSAYTFINIAKRTKHAKIAIKRTRNRSSWAMLCTSLINVPGNYSWVIIVYENTFVILENLRWFLASLVSTDHYLGHSVEYWGTKYNTGEAGYVLSNSTLIKLKISLNGTLCNARNIFLNKEDLYLGKSLANLNIFPADTRDSLGYTTFHKYSWQHELFPTDFNYKSSTFPVLCCSQKSITFQVQSNNNMYFMQYLLYKLKVFQFGDKGNRPFLNEVPDFVIWQTFLKQQGIISMNISSEEYYHIWQHFVEDPDTVNKRIKEELNIHL